MIIKYKNMMVVYTYKIHQMCHKNYSINVLFKKNILQIQKLFLFKLTRLHKDIFYMNSYIILYYIAY